MNRPEPVRWGIIGTGGIVQRRMLPAFRATGSEITAILSSSADRASSIAAQHGINRSYSSMEDFLGNADMEAVYVASTNDLHCRHVLACAEAGKHVLCEKPIALNPGDAARMVATCKNRGVVLGVNHYHRLKASFVAIHDLIADGSIGDPLIMNVAFAVGLRPDQLTWRVNSIEAGGGVVLDLTVHQAEFLRYLTNSEVLEVVAMTSKTRSRAEKPDDSVAGSMFLASGLLCAFVNSLATPSGRRGLAVWGTEGCVWANDIFGADTDGKVTVVRKGSDPEDVALRPWQNPLANGLEAFNRSVRGAGSPAVTGLDGAKALAVAYAVHESASEHRTIEVTDIERLVATSIASEAAI